MIYESIFVHFNKRWKKKNVKKNFKGITMQVCTIVKIIFVFLTAASK